MKTPFSDSPYPIYEGKHWDIILHRDNQAHLGRSIVFLKNRYIEDPIDLTREEQEELWFDILPKFRKAINTAFKPDALNYGYHGLSIKHLHMHVIPRYNKNPVREFAGETFTDQLPDKNYNKSQKKAYDVSVMKAIAEKLRQEIANL